MTHTPASRFTACLHAARIIAVLALSGSFPLPAEEIDDGIRIVPVLEESFDNNEQGWPGLEETHVRRAMIRSSTLFWHNRLEDRFQSTTKPLPLSSRRNYEIALEARCDASAGTPGWHGVSWGASVDPFQEYAFMVHPSEGWRLVTEIDGNIDVLASGPLDALYRSNNNNLLTLRKIDDQLTLFVNGMCVLVRPMPTPFGNHIGPNIGPGVGAIFSSLRISYLRGEAVLFAEKLAAYRAGVGDMTRSFFGPPVVKDISLAEPIKLARDPAEWSVVEGWFQTAWDHSQNNRNDEAAALLRDVIAHAPDFPPAHRTYAWTALMLGDLATARASIDFALSMEPANLAMHALAAYVAAAENNSPRAIELLRTTAFLDAGGANRAALHEDIKLLTPAISDPTAMRQLDAEIDRVYAQRDTTFDPIAATIQRAREAHAANNTAAERTAVDELMKQVDTLPSGYAWLAVPILTDAGWSLAFTDEPASARPAWEEAYRRLRSTRTYQSDVTINRLAQYLGSSYLNIGEASLAEQIARAELPITMRLPRYLESRKDDLLELVCMATNAQERYARSYDQAKLLLERARRSGDTFREATALNLVAMSFTTTQIADERAEVRRLLETAEKLCVEHHYPELLATVRGNLAISYYVAGETARASAIYVKNAREAEAAGRILDAELAYNNAGALAVHQERFPEATRHFQSAVKLIERHRDTLIQTDRLNFLQRRRGAYQFLAECQARAGDVAGLFATQSAIRARVLAEQLYQNQSPPDVTLAAFQASLAADETAVIYTLLGGGEVIIHTIDRAKARAQIVRTYQPFIGLKKLYQERMSSHKDGYKPTLWQIERAGNLFNVRTSEANQISVSDMEEQVEILQGVLEKHIQVPPDQAPIIIDNFLRAFSALMVEPLQGNIAPGRKLLIMPDDLLYFVPFEALRWEEDRYVAQVFDVRYVQSPAVRQILRQRNYAANRRDLLAMGGAKYAAMEDSAPPVNSPQRHAELAIKVDANARLARSQREAFAALFGTEPMKYLAGSLREVAALRAIMPDSAVYVGEWMTENYLKALSTSGELAQFRYVHLATHGFAVPDFPQLSGVAMSIFPTVQDGEDGYLTAPEIARLKMNADLAVLSACQTGLGRIQGGEGIAGLTSSLLIGGANQALVTLWSVSDQGTMLFMTEVYGRLAQGQSVPRAVAEIRRMFIAGEFGPGMAEPYIWAPFVLYGP